MWIGSRTKNGAPHSYSSDLMIMNEKVAKKVIFQWRIGAALILLLIRNARAQPGDRSAYVFLNGDFRIGALFPVHHQPAAKYRQLSAGIQCGDVREMYGIQRVEVALQTLDKINADVALLPNVTLGAEIRDDCWYAPVALQQSIELIRDAIAPTTPHSAICRNTSAASIREAKGPLIGVVSPGSSSVALQVQNLLQLFHLPQIGYSTTSKDLSDKSRFNYFLRVVPSDHFQAQVMLDIVRHHGWTYVSVVNTDENYGQSGIQAFRELAEEADVCIAREDSVLSNSADEGFDKVILNLKQDPNAHVVVCFCEGLTVRGLLAATRRLNMSNHFLFIGSDGWADRSDVTQDLENQAWGSFSVRIHSPYVQDFDRHFWTLRPATNVRNPWFREFWQMRFSCWLPDATMRSSTPPRPVCTGNESLAQKYRQDSKLSFVIKAIYSLAYGLHNMQQDVCGHASAGICDRLLPFNGSLFKSYLLNVSFEYEGDVIEFDENGDPPGRYDIMNFQRRADGSFDYVHVADWNNRSLEWVASVQFGPRSLVTSVCSQECPLGHYKNIQLGGKDKRCCWVCVRCPSGEILDATSNSMRCIKCPLGYATDPNQTICLRLPIEYTQWLDTPAIIALLLAAAGFLSTWFALALFVRHHRTPVVKSSTRELSYIILGGMSLSHASVFPILARPTPLTCAMSRLLPGLSFAMIYAALLTKTNRIARILAVAKRRFPVTRRRRLMSTAAQVFITSLLIAIESAVAVGMLVLQPAGVSFAYEARRTRLQCNTTPAGILVPLAFDSLLVALCTLYALKTRNVPANFNEAKFIGFAMYTTCVIWVAFVPIYFGSDAKAITMCVCVTLSAMVTWLFLFAPKLYIIIVRPERNHRAFFTTSKSIRCHVGTRVSAPQEKQEKRSLPPSKRTLSCQTGVELLQVLLSPRLLMDVYSPQKARVPRITENDCCPADNCCYKKIVIHLPESSDASVTI